MTPPTEFEEEIKILEPFLFSYHFTLADLKSLKGSSGLFTKATYANDKKKFVICIKNRESLDKLDYQFDNYTVMHGFYIDEVCRPNDRHYGYDQPSFEKEDLVTQLKKILADFEYLIDDFFTGQCAGLKNAAEFQSIYFKERQEKGRTEAELKNNKDIIDKARQQFKIRNYQGCIDIYKTVSKNYVLTESDKRTIQLCNQHLTA